MESINKLNPERAGPAQNSSKTVRRPKDDVALSRLLAKDPVLGKVMKILFGKLDETNKRLDETNKRLDETNKRLDDLQCERSRDVDLGQDQVHHGLASEVKVVEEGQFTMLAFPPAVRAEDKSDDDKGRKAVEDCSGLVAIRRRILEQLSDKELINLSLVNKFWNFEARSMLRDRGCLKAKITAEPTCQSLVYFASDLEQMHVVPFTGIHVHMGHKDGSRKTCQSTAAGSLDSSYQVILDKLPTKHLSVNFPSGWRGPQDCPLFVFARRILENCCGALEELSISAHNNSSAEFIQTITQGYSFPCLKTLKYDDRYPLPSEFAKALVSSAPNLEKFYVKGPIEFMENVMEGSSAELVAAYFNPLSDQVCESLISALRPEIIRLHNVYKRDVKLFDGLVPLVLQASSTTLKTLILDLLFAVPLMCYGIFMENVTNLWIYTSDTTVGGIQPDVLAILKGFDFTRVFPKLDKVTIADDRGSCCPSDAVSAFLERGNAILRKNFPHRAINIRQLDLKKFYGDSTPPLPLLAQMFPHVQNLLVEEADQEFPFTLLWQHFGSLAELHVKFQGSRSHIAENLDSVFCGIFPEEVAELRAKDDEYLKAVNIVPVMPSITCMKGLRLFQLQYFGGITRKDSNRLFSKVTGMIGFQRCPALSVKLQNQYSTEGSDHIRPYVTQIDRFY